MSAFLHGDWLLLYYQQYYRSSRQGFFSLSSSLALVSLLAVSLTPSQPTEDDTVRVSALLGGLAFGVFLLAAILLLFASVHDEQITAALAYERMLEDKEARGMPLGGFWHRSIHSARAYERRGVKLSEQEPGSLQARWHKSAKAELYQRRKTSFLLAIVGRWLMMVGVLLLIATVVCIAKFKITPHSASDGLWIALLVVLCIVGALIVALVCQQDVHAELFNPGPAPVRVSQDDEL